VRWPLREDVQQFVRADGESRAQEAFGFVVKGVPARSAVGVAARP
jgi:hypothetical protein